MTARALHRKSRRLGVEASELMVAAPLVIAYRASRMLAAGWLPTMHDRRELLRMGSEKVDAFSEAWAAAALQMARSNRQMAAATTRGWINAWLSLWSSPRFGRRPARATLLQSAQGRLQHAALDIMAKSLAPVHRRALGNATRLSRLKRR